MRIAYFSDNSYPELSGIVDSILITGKELVARGHEVVFVGPRYSPANYAKAKRALMLKDGHEVIDGLRIIRIPSLPLPFSPTGQSRFSFPFGSSFSFLDSWKPDIIHTQSPYGTGFEALRAARRYKVPLIGTNHTPIEEFYPWAPELMRNFDAWYYNHCDFITAPYANLLKNMREKGFKKPAQVMANPISLPLYNPASSEEKGGQKNKLGLTGPVILYCGRLSVEKRVRQVIEGLATLMGEFPDLTFIATGHGSEKANLEALSKKLGMEKNVLFTDFVATEVLPSYYRAADVFALMSTSDSQSLALMQAFASGIPAVGARSRGLPDYLPPTCGYLVEPGDSKAFAERVRELLLNPVLREQMGKAGVEFVKQFSPQKIAAEWEEIYQHYGKNSD